MMNAVFNYRYNTTSTNFQERNHTYSGNSVFRLYNVDRGERLEPGLRVDMEVPFLYAPLTQEGFQVNGSLPVTLPGRPGVDQVASFGLSPATDIIGDFPDGEQVVVKLMANVSSSTVLSDGVFAVDVDVGQIIDRARVIGTQALVSSSYNKLMVAWIWGYLKPYVSGKYRVGIKIRTALKNTPDSYDDSLVYALSCDLWGREVTLYAKEVTRVSSSLECDLDDPEWDVRWLFETGVFEFRDGVADDLSDFVFVHDS